MYVAGCKSVTLCTDVVLQHNLNSPGKGILSHAIRCVWELDFDSVMVVLGIVIVSITCFSTNMVVPVSYIFPITKH